MITSLLGHLTIFQMVSANNNYLLAVVLQFWFKERVMKARVLMSCLRNGILMVSVLEGHFWNLDYITVFFFSNRSDIKHRCCTTCKNICCCKISHRRRGLFKVERKHTILFFFFFFGE